MKDAQCTAHLDAIDATPEKKHKSVWEEFLPQNGLKQPDSACEGTCNHR